MIKNLYGININNWWIFLKNISKFVDYIWKQFQIMLKNEILCNKIIDIQYEKEKESER